jgi:hypothetical protein
VTHAEALGGKRLALCVGIDHYPNPLNELSGCVADARMWAESLHRLGFTTSLLTDKQATRNDIEQELKALLAQSRAGDVVVFQYAGHGTHVPDLDGDEGVSGEDQALCPIDFETGALFIDDDLRKVLGQAPDGVCVTCFMDCCHSGSIIRMGMGPGAMPASGHNERQRYIRATPELIEAHRNYRRELAARGVGPPASDLIRHVSFAACKDSESAWESDGHGEFTLRATRLLEEGIASVSNDEFERRVLAAFGVQRRQEPQLFCDDDKRALMLLQPLRSDVGPGLGGEATSPSPASGYRRNNGGAYNRH